jgi:hypothetical protein
MWYLAIAVTECRDRAPEGQATIAQPFKAGMRRGQVQVPKGRLNKCRYMQSGDTTLAASRRTRAAQAPSSARLDSSSKLNTVQTSAFKTCHSPGSDALAPSSTPSAKTKRTSGEQAKYKRNTSGIQAEYNRITTGLQPTHTRVSPNLLAFSWLQPRRSIQAPSTASRPQIPSSLGGHPSTAAVGCGERPPQLPGFWMNPWYSPM